MATLSSVRLWEIKLKAWLWVLTQTFYKIPPTLAALKTF